MSPKILVAYATNAGSTQDVANAIAKELELLGAQAEVCPIEQTRDISQYQAVVIGGPMIVGWHRRAVGFLKRNHKALAGIPVACFITAISLTETGERRVRNVPVVVDSKLPKQPVKAGKLSLRERYASVGNYQKPILRSKVNPVSVGIFAGKMEFFRLKPLQIPLAMILAQGKTGDFRNWEEIGCWAREVYPSFLKESGSQ